MTIALYIYGFCFLLIILACAAYVALLFRRKIARVERKKLELTRHPENPMIAPLPYREWEASGTFNPAVFQDDEGMTHILYRAIGDDGVSRIGHAATKDGYHIDERSQYPVYTPQPGGYGMPPLEKLLGPREYDPIAHPSGGGWAGCEDPRAVRIGDKVYMTFVAFEGWDSVRIALTSIKLSDFKKRRWNWRRPVLISSKKEISKNWLIFPEKIHGKYAVLHRLSPTVLIEYVDSLDMFWEGKPIRSTPPSGGRKNFWDNRMRGGGPPPLRTNMGWLLLYHANDNREPEKYKLGAMILDINDPSKILYRSPQPILSPDMPYENNIKPGIVYASGALIKDDNLFVYYGGGDYHVCVAETPLKGLLDWLVMYGKV